jgi:transposase
LKEDWLMKRKGSELTVEFKRAAVALMAPGVKISSLAHELGVRRQRLYEWREALRLGDDRLRRPGRPKRMIEPPAQGDDLASARRRIAELERRLGQQQLELDFFKQALRQVEALRRPSDGPGATASTPSSKR